MTPEKKNQAALTRETILGAAIGLFQEHGFSGLGMRQIADCLDIKAPSLYHHFTSKEDLARQALQLYREGQAARLLTIEETGDLSEQLRMYAELFAGILDDDSRPLHVPDAGPRTVVSERSVRRRVAAVCKTECRVAGAHAAHEHRSLTVD